MSWFGKVLGGTLGYMMGGPMGMILGAALGHNFDRGVHHTHGTADTQERRQIAFYVATFSVMGHLCKADGHVSQAEIRTARQIMQQMSMNSRMRALAIDLFNQGKQPGFDLDAVMDQFRNELGLQPNLYRMFLEIQIMAACADGSLHHTERAILEHVCGRLGLPIAELDRLCQIIGGMHTDGGWQHRAAQPSTGIDPTRAREILGVGPNAEMPDIKRAYRRLMNQHHPDKLVAKGLPPEMVQIATERTVEIRQAYDALKAHHT